MAIPLIGVRFGDQLTQLREQSDSPRVEFQADGVVLISRHWKVDSGSNLALAPKPKDLDALGYHARCVTSVIQHGKQNISDIMATYQGYVTLPPSIYEFSNSRFDRPIQLHPQFNNPSYFPDATKAYAVPDPATPTVKVFVKFKDSDPVGANNKFRGVEAYITGSSQWRKTSYALNPDFDQQDVGKLNPPETGPYVGLPDQLNTLNSWLKIEKTCVNLLKGASILWQITEVWQFNLDRWVIEIYGP